MARCRQRQFLLGLVLAVLNIDIAKASKCSDICKPFLNTSLPCPLRPTGEDPPVLACANDELRDSQHYRTGCRITTCNSGNIQIAQNGAIKQHSFLQCNEQGLWCDSNNRFCYGADTPVTCSKNPTGCSACSRPRKAGGHCKPGLKCFDEELVESVKTLNGCKMWKCNPGYSMNVATGSFGWVTVADYAECHMNRMRRLNGVDAFYNWEVSCVPIVTCKSESAPKCGANSECVDDPKGATCSCVAGYQEINGSCVEDSKEGVDEDICMFDDGEQSPVFCLHGYFCPFFTKSLAKSGALCRDGEVMVASTMAMPNRRFAPASKVVCGLDNLWQPFGVPKLLNTACGVPIESLSRQLPAGVPTECTPLFPLSGSDLDLVDVRYFFDQAAGRVYATCLTGMITGLTVRFSAETTAAMFSCTGVNGWEVLGEDATVNAASCESGMSCLVFMKAQGYTRLELSMLELSALNAGHCGVKCRSGADLKFSSTNGQPGQAASATAYKGLIKYIAEDGTAGEITPNTITCEGSDLEEAA